MSKERACIRGSEVVSVEVGKVWTIVKIKIPTETVVRRGVKRNPERPASMIRKPKPDGTPGGN